MKPFRISDRLHSFSYAWKGIRRFVGQEHNAWIHCMAVAAVTCAGFCFGITRSEWIAVVFCFGLVLAAEGFNSAIERIVDLVSPERLPLAGEIKDIAAGSVLIAAIAAAIIGIIIFLPYILLYIK
ncbi:MAG: diacylglycerol kinase family protein [Prevotellaceae bacterium]|nr:diacylglycerol kinase family protein [Prevotellaceae bacterium]